MNLQVKIVASGYSLVCHIHRGGPVARMAGRVCCSASSSIGLRKSGSLQHVDIAFTQAFALLLRLLKPRLGLAKGSNQPVLLQQASKSRQHDAQNQKVPWHDRYHRTLTSRLSQQKL